MLIDCAQDRVNVEMMTHVEGPIVLSPLLSIAEHELSLILYVSAAIHDGVDHIPERQHRLYCTE